MKRHIPNPNLSYSPQPNNLRTHRYVPSRLQLAMRFCTNLRLVAPNKTPTAPRITTTTRVSYSMSDEATKTDQSVADTSSVGKAPEKAPYPPEKPLPDDCCGSGCVRCVWDAYYDALEDYNKLFVVANNNVSDDNKDV